jgi:DNA/RNA-binding domain of Phe-tRNA-synthetase-like protein
VEPLPKDIECFNNLTGWRLHFAWLKLNEGDHEAVLRMASEAAVTRFKRKFSDNSYRNDPIVRSIHSLLMSSGLPKDKCLTSFELLAQVVLSGNGIRSQKPGVLFRDLLSLKSMVPWSIMDILQVRFPLTFRMGREEETLREDGNTLNLKGCPVLCDKAGRLRTPITLADEDEEITGSCRDILLVCYAPIERAREVAAKSHVGSMVHMTQAFRFVMERAFLPKGR